MQQCFLGVKVEMSFNGLRLEYALEGSSNYIAWKDRMEAVLDDNGLKEFIDTDIPKPIDATQADAWQKKIAKCRRILWLSFELVEFEFAAVFSWCQS